MLGLFFGWIVCLFVYWRLNWVVVVWWVWDLWFVLLVCVLLLRLLLWIGFGIVKFWWWCWLLCWGCRVLLVLVWSCCWCLLVWWGCLLLCWVVMVLVVICRVWICRIVSVVGGWWWVDGGVVFGLEWVCCCGLFGLIGWICVLLVGWLSLIVWCRGCWLLYWFD